MPETVQASLISALPPSQSQKRAAFVAAACLLALFFSVLPVAHVRLGQLDVFIPIVATVMFITDSITATLLYAQFTVLRSRALLVLANGYLFTALIVVPYALTFPNAFTPEGLLGAGLQTTGWLFMTWHIGLPATIIAYTLLKAAPTKMQFTRGSVSFAILVSIGCVIALVCLLTWFVTAHSDVLPVMVLSVTDIGGIVYVITAIVFLLCITAFLLLWFRERSLLDLWLLVVSLAWLLDAIILNLIKYRFDVAWYANRVFGITSATFVLLVLLAESTMLYARLALSVLAQRREREGRLMSMDAMTAAIAHEVKQPLGAIVTNANASLRWLDKTPPDLKEARDTLKHIAADGHRASEVIQSVRGMFAKSDQAGTLVNTNELVRESIALVQGELEAARIAVQLELSELLPLITAHRGQLQQVMLNLIANAADAMRSVTDRRRVLQVKTAPSASNGILLSVADSGIGINPKDNDRIFDPFFTTKSRGMGMGLAVCRSILEGHGGSLSVSSNVPHGSVFQVVLPDGEQAKTRSL